MTNTTATLELLNENDSPLSYHGTLLSDDGQNQLWLFGNQVANRYQDDEMVCWSNDVSGWGYDDNSDVLE
jgi:hypothetical protein